jgi:hypothetical protein
MARNAKSKRKRAPKTVLKLPDLEQSKSALLNSWTTVEAPRGRRLREPKVLMFATSWHSIPLQPARILNRMDYNTSLELRRSLT